MEEIGADLPAQRGGDVEVGAGERLPGGKGAIGAYLGAAVATVVWLIAAVIAANLRPAATAR